MYKIKTIDNRGLTRKYEYRDVIITGHFSKKFGFSYSATVNEKPIKAEALKRDNRVKGYHTVMTEEIDKVLNGE